MSLFLKMKYSLLFGFLFLILLVRISCAYQEITLNPTIEITTDDDNNEIEACNTKDPFINYCSIDNDASGEEEYTYLQYELNNIKQEQIIEARLIFGMNDDDDTEHTDVGFISQDEYLIDYNNFKMDLIKYGTASQIINDLKDNSCCKLTGSNDLNCDCDITNTVKTKLITSSIHDDVNKISFQWHMDDSCRDDCDNAQVMGYNPESETRKAELYIKINEYPKINCPNLYINEDSEAGWLADLNGCTNDDDTGLTYFILSQSNSNLINCYLENNKFVCNKPKLNAYGYSDIKIRVQDKYGLIDENSFRLNVRSIDDPAVWEVLEDKQINEDTNETLIYENLKSKCSDIDSDINMKINSVSEHYELSFSGNNLIINNLEENYFSNETIELDCNGILNIFDLIILPINDVPKINIENVAIEEDSEETIIIDLIEYVIDVDNLFEDLSFMLEQDNKELIDCVIKENKLECNELLENGFGENNILLKVSDLELSSEKEFKIIVNSVNDAPYFLPIENMEIYDNETINLDLSEYAKDVDNEELNFSVESEYCSVNEDNLFCGNLIEGLFDVLLKVSDGLLEAETNFSVNVLKFEIQVYPEPSPPSNNGGSSSGSSSGGGKKIEIIEEVVEEKVLPIVEEIPEIEEKVVEEVKEVIEIKKESNFSIAKIIGYCLIGFIIILVGFLLYNYSKYGGFV